MVAEPELIEDRDAVAFNSEALLAFGAVFNNGFGSVSGMFFSES